MINVYERHLNRRNAFTTRMLLAFVATLLGFLTLISTNAVPAKADLAAVGPVSPDNNYPTYFQDATGLQLELCISGPGCAMAPAIFGAPDGESFYYMATADLDTPDGPVALEFATEAAYAAAGSGQEIVFNRVLVKGVNVKPGLYRAITPYGTFEMEANTAKGLKYVDDRGCMDPVLCPSSGFATAKLGSIGPNYLTWDTFGTGSPDAPPAGFVGDAATPHKVVGSTIDSDGDSTNGVQPQDFFKLEEIDASGSVIRNMGSTDLFTVQGKLHGVTAFANPKGGIFNTDQAVNLTASDPVAKVVYTTGNGSQADPAVNPATGEITAGTDASVTPAFITDTTTPNTDTTTVKYIAAKQDAASGQWVSSPVLTQTYTIDKVAPGIPTELTLAPESDSGVAGDRLTNVRTPKLSGKAEAKSIVKVFDGITLLGQTTADNAGNWTFTVPGNKALSSQGLHNINATSTDAAGNASGNSADLGITLDTVIPKVAASPGQGVYGPNQKFTLTPNEEARVYFTTDRTIPDATDTEYTTPLSFTSTTTLKYIGIDTAGNRSQVATQVYTIDRTSPKVVLSSRTPSANATGVAVGTNVTTSFNEAVKGVRSTTFILKKGTTRIPAVVTYNATTRKAVLNPNANLSRKTKYTVTLTGGIRDLVGNPLAQTSWNFTTR